MAELPTLTDAEDAGNRPADRDTGPKRILLFGCGAFARQAHLPALRDAGARVRLAAIVDHTDRAAEVFGACSSADLPRDVPFIHLDATIDGPTEGLAGRNQSTSPTEADVTDGDHIAPVPPAACGDGILRAHVANPNPSRVTFTDFAALAARLPEADAVIISSPEDSHKPYIEWALRRGVPTLVDKPLTARCLQGETLSGPRELVDDWRALVEAAGETPFMLATQRRYQSVYREVAALVRQDYLRNGYAPTFVQCLTNDGLWHAPGDYAHQPTYRNGAGKLVHTGYHVLDIVPWIIRHGQAPERPGSAILRIRTAVIFASRFSPADASAARSHEPGASTQAPRLVPTLGEVNAALQISLRDDDGRTVCIVQLGLLHEGLSLNPGTSSGTTSDRRVEADGGRTKQDILSIYQGPTSAIFLRRFAKLTGERGTGLGDRDHLELVHARNPRLPGGPAVLETRTLTYRADDDAPTAEFLRALDDPEMPVISPVADHGIAVKLLAAAYLSMESGESETVAFDDGEWRTPPGPPVPGLPAGAVR